jgi:aspartyl-tRNA(Asn)/glutamyl-tRNA(Gln) amidotransferase subunit A
LESAKHSDDRIQKGHGRLLEGIPLAFKDLFCTKGIQTTAGSKMLQNFVPFYESTVTQKLLDVGAFSLGKTNMDEFAMGSANVTSYFGPCLNPYQTDKQLTPGGSSGGSASAVAARLCLGATGSDTGGSIRQPASFCGVVGIKPTYGLCSRFGMVAFASSLDQAGPMALCVEDAALLLHAMAGYDPQDSTSLNIDVPSYGDHLNPNLKGYRIGVPWDFLKGADPDVIASLHKGIDFLKDAGAVIVDISLPLASKCLPVYYIIAPAEASSNLSRYDGVRYGQRVPGASLDDMYEKTRADGFGEEVKRRLLIGTYVLSSGYYDAYYTKALKIKKLLEKDFKNAFLQVDTILTPTTNGVAFGIHDKNNDPISMYLNDIFTVPANLAGLPGISVPIDMNSQGLPLGLQFIGPKLSEQSLLNCAKAIEDRAAFKGI